MAKKKLEEFTVKEIERVCSARDKNCYYKNLSNECPFILICHYAMDTLPVEELEREVEIPDWSKCLFDCKEIKNESVSNY